MPAPISIVIPTLNVADRIGPCLAAIYPAILAGLIKEVIFADGGSTDETQQIALEWGAEFVSAPKGRGQQLQVGADHAHGEWIMVVHADTVMSLDWIEVVRFHISERKTAGYGRLRFDATGVWPFIFARWANLRSAVFGLPYGDQTLLIHRTLYNQVGGYQAIPLMEDVAIAKALRGRLQGLNFTATTSADKYHRNGWLVQGMKNMRFLCRYLIGADPKGLAKDY